MFLAGGLAGASAQRVGFTAIRLAIGIFVLPYMFIYKPALLLMGTPLEILLTTCIAAATLFSLAVAFEGYLIKPLNWLERVLLAVGGILMIFPELTTNAIGAAAAIAGVGLHLLRARLAKV